MTAFQAGHFILPTYLLLPSWTVALFTFPAQTLKIKVKLHINLQALNEIFLKIFNLVNVLCTYTYDCYYKEMNFKRFAAGHTKWFSELCHAL